MLLADLVATADAVAATSKRTEKVWLLADLFARVAADPQAGLGPGAELPVAVGLLAGEPRQGRIGVGWATISAVDVTAAQEPSVSVLELDAVLSRLAAAIGPGSAGVRAAELAGLFARTTPAEAEFIRRVLAGELRHGALASLVADAVAKATGIPQVVVRRATMLSGDLASVAAAAQAGGREVLEAIGLKVGHAVQPMLAGTAPDVAAALAACGRSSVEWKLDGIRIQVHRHGDRVAVFTRNLNDITDRLPGIVELVRAFEAERFVLDGEAIGLGGDDRPDLFQDTLSSARSSQGERTSRSHSPVCAWRKGRCNCGSTSPAGSASVTRTGRQTGESGSTLVPRFFDCLHLDGVDLLDRPLHERRPVLEGLVGALAVPATVTDDAHTAAAVLAESLAAGHEGVVVKSVASAYEAGRRGKNWRKVKPVDTLDLVILAAEWGHGRRHGWLSNLHLGARATGSGSDSEFVMVGKTFKGLTDELLTWQTGQLLAREVDRSSYVVNVRPELVVEVALDGVQRSTRYPGGVALRFARVRRYRPDKDTADADTIDTVRALL